MPWEIVPVGVEEFGKTTRFLDGCQSCVAQQPLAPDRSHAMLANTTPSNLPNFYLRSSTQQDLSACDLSRENGQAASPGVTPNSHKNQNSAQKDRPSFHETTIHHPIFTLLNGSLMPEIMASIQGGFSLVDRKWTCYRRNSFIVQCSFRFRNGMVDGPFYLNRNGSAELIKQFAVSISARTFPTGSGESEACLVQLTPERNNATKSVPSRRLISPSPNDKIFDSNAMANSSGLENRGPNSIPTSHTFRRIQFQRATAKNKTPLATHQYFLVVVELSANIGRQADENWIMTATKESDPMIVRGRPCGHWGTSQVATGSSEPGESVD
ncbi:uncharacterized protein Z520_03739 [Fonsecaea multimorphosa CBS 102226]|uniref:NDT80 domain-containing protein n=1 Tax=Fonsecaea multimorphosa CBS 102226 TaxID=1442371 RepID=A0A0D2KTG8_9EURO|nr:uncharacterized protein Z520_03739 [Fonsecaea multimorphosa CBS 102226]KIY00054.1 hypothetical protein Z520_03739 [Fonsecaea multimorphosa CBS 102226]